VLDRIPLPAEKDIPDAAQTKETDLTHWRLQGPKSRSSKSKKENVAASFFFSADTVERAKEFYTRVRHLPYRADAGSKGLYEAYSLRGGWMIPPGLIQGLPAWARATYGDHTVWQWRPRAC